jgi:transcriptional regulator with XRE-family HTH domain
VIVAARSAWYDKPQLSDGRDPYRGASAMIKQFDTGNLARDEHGHEHRLPGSRRGRAEHIDRHVGMRMRERRIMLGLSQQQLAELIGVTFQQTYKYEKGITRVAAGHLYEIAQALGVDVGYFFEGIGRDDAFGLTQQQRLLLEFARCFMAIPNRSHQEEIISLARALAEPDAGLSVVRQSRRPRTSTGPL